jgi:hypothetical protein
MSKMLSSDLKLSLCVCVCVCVHVCVFFLLRGDENEWGDVNVHM